MPEFNGSLDFSANSEPGFKVLVNGVAKSGTHLLRKIVNLCGLQIHPFCLAANTANRAVVLYNPAHEGILGSALDIGASHPTPIHELLLRQMIRTIKPGFVFNGHLAFDPALLSLLQSENVRVINLLRDPRDILVSLARYLVKHQHPVTQGKSESQLLHEALTGMTLNSNPLNPPRFQRNLGETCSAALPWRDHEEVLTLKFEDLVGPEGGGDLGVQMDSIRQVLAFLGRDPDMVMQIRDQVFGGTRTFASGQIGNWRQVFDAALKEHAKEVLGDYLVRSGYEQDSNW